MSDDDDERESKHKELCPNCGASMMINKYSMNKTLLRSLIKITRNPGKTAKEINFTKSEYSVYTKLKWWGFIEQLEDGLWRVTQAGKDFLSGKTLASKEVGYFRNKLVYASEEKISVWQIVPTDESKQKYREMMVPYL